MEDGGEGGLGYWIRWQVPVCFLIIASPAVVATAVISRARADPLRAVDLWIPCWTRANPLWLLAFRGLALVVLSCLLYQMVLLDGAFAFYFYTQWTFTLVIIYFLIATSISAHGCWIYSKHVTEIEEADGFIKRDCEENMPTMNSGPNRNRKAIKLQRYYEQGENEQKAGFWGYIMQVTYQVPLC